ncbi:hypothetical protein SISNIDRAFT_491246 [Sistotremastrum niveocremeum HHB9708]|uniref:Uncharacterized protein n=1 Tax=Sistotremastrum niveocremeum HHB9708 TaxID=1314777 RepID=A0A164MYP2_9AGAM|nr:hypothetical protein SISNIDRAFT_491246 [Sistotremastrum niveocremeum HHB9708]
MSTTTTQTVTRAHHPKRNPTSNSKFVLKLNSIEDPLAKNVYLLKCAVRGAAGQLRDDIRQMSPSNPTFILWHSVRRPKRALQEAIDHLLEAPPCDVSTVLEDMSNEEFTHNLFDTVKGMLHTSLISKLERQQRRQKARPRSPVILFNDPQPLNTICEE